MSTPKPLSLATRYTYFMLVRTTPQWLSLSREARMTFADKVFKPVVGKFPAVSLRYFDAEAFNARCTDVLMWETTDPAQYNFMVDALRDTPMYSVPYFEIVDIIGAVEDSYAAYDEQVLGKTDAVRVSTSVAS
jgi:Darcynin, domain of unknown function